MSLLEDTILNRYRSDRRPMNHEVVGEIKLETIIEDLHKIIDFVRINGSVGSSEHIQKYNDDINTPDIEVVGEGNPTCIGESSDEETSDNESSYDESSDDESNKEDTDSRIEEVEKRLEIVEEKQESMYDEILKELGKYTDKN
jgi:hypothetical protein